MSRAPRPGDRVRIKPGYDGDTQPIIGHTATVVRVTHHHDEGWPSSIEVELDEPVDGDRGYVMFAFDVEVLS